MKASFLFLFPLGFCISLYFQVFPPTDGTPSTPSERAYFAPKTDPGATKTDSFLEGIMRRYPQYFSQVLANRDPLKVQVIYTQIDRDAHNKPSFRDFYFNVNPGKYFYPASTVKMPLAFLALQRLNELGIPGLHKSSSMVTEAAYSGQTAVYNDPSTRDGRPSVEQYVKKIFLVSDNDACNRLYEFLGQEYVNDRLHQMGYTDVEFRHRLSIFLSEDENRHTNPIDFFDTTGKLLYHQPLQQSQERFSQRNDYVGNGYYDGTGKQINQPMDFSKKNRISLEDQHRILRSVIFPESVPRNQRFNLTDSDYQFIYHYMSQYPPETNYPPYDSTSTWDAYCKFLYWGSEKGALPKQIRIFNKVGDAYGFLTDIIYFTDLKNNIEFMLSATIYCNSAGILNSEKYDYESVGFPFMKNLGHVIYDYESKRKRLHIPDLSKFRITYDK